MSGDVLSIKILKLNFLPCTHNIWFHKYPANPQPYDNIEVRSQNRTTNAQRHGDATAKKNTNVPSTLESRFKTQYTMDVVLTTLL